MRYSDELIEEVRARNDIVDVVGSYVHLKRAGRSYVGLCPFHNERTPSFSVSPDSQLYYCFGCHAGGNVYTFMMQYLNSSFSEALQMLADRAGITVPEETMSAVRKEAEDRKSKMLEAARHAAAYYVYKLRTKSGETGLSYLKKRNLTDETIKNFGLGYAGKYSDELYRYLKSKGYSDDILRDTGLFTVTEKDGFRDRFWNRVMFPICDVRSRVIGFGGRVMGDGKPKYLNSPESELFNKRRNLFGMQIARIHGRERILLCEGYMDAIALHQAGFQNAVASLGTALTEEQAVLLKRYTKEVILMYDSDGAGTNAAVRAIPILMNAGLIVKRADLRPYKDPDELLTDKGPEEMEKRIEGALNGFLFLTDEAKGRYDLSDPQEKTAFERSLCGMILRSFPDELERNNYLEAVCRRHMIRTEAMQSLLRRMAASGLAEAEKVRLPQDPEGTVPDRKPKGSGKVNKQETGAQATEKLMLSFLVNYKDSYRASCKYVTEDDFLDPFLHSIAVLVYEGIREGSLKEAQILDHFTELDEQKEAAGVFHAAIPVKDQDELDRAFTDTVIRLMKQSNDMRMKAWNGDLEEMKSLIKKKALIDDFSRNGEVLHIERRE